MSDRLTPEREAEIRERTPKRAAALTAWIDKFSPVGGQSAVENAETVLEEDVPALLAELAAVRAERDEFCDRVDTLTAVAKGNKRHVQELFLELQKAHARIRELERPAIEAARNAIRQSYTGLIAQAEQDRDDEGAAHLRDRLRDREAQWKREDEEAAR